MVTAGEQGPTTLTQFGQTRCRRSLEKQAKTHKQTHRLKEERNKQRKEEENRREQSPTTLTQLGQTGNRRSLNNKQTHRFKEEKKKERNKRR